MTISEEQEKIIVDAFNTKLAVAKICKCGNCVCCSILKSINESNYQLKDFWNSSLRNTWINTKFINVYVRKAVRFKDQINTLDIATIEVKQGYRGRGVFTLFLQRAEQFAEEKKVKIYIENVMNKKFQNFFLNRAGYKHIEGSYPSSFIKL